jgi:hypothetical protein
LIEKAAFEVRTVPEIEIGEIRRATVFELRKRPD